MKANIQSAMLSDGFLRLTLDALLSTRIVHVVSGIDGEEGSRIRKCGALSFITGYTEWGCDKPHLPISIGWDWSLEKVAGEVCCRRVGMPRSNVMLLTAGLRDYGWGYSLLALAQVVDALPWAEQTRAAMRIR